MTPSIPFTCPNPACGKRLKTDTGGAGKAARCHGCGTRFRLARSTSADGSESVIPTDPEIPALAPPPPTTTNATTANHPLPDVIGRFRVLGFLGGGAFGLVYRARDPELERDVAVKVPKPGTLTTPARVQRFLGDAKAGARLRHPHIVPVFDVGDHDGGWFIASAFIDGRTLADVTEEGRLDLRAKVAVVRRLAEALDYAHGQGVVHRDVKPDNVVLDADGQPHLIDFGLAKLGDDRAGGGRAVMGTPVYMSPEQASGHSHDADARSDQYSLGVTLYELLGGRTPFAGPTEVVLHNVVNTEPPPLAALDPTLPLDLVLICQRAMAKDPAGRYATCGDFADDLRRWLDGETPRVRVLTRRERLARWVRKEPKLAAAVGVAAAAVLLAAVLGVLFGVSSSRQARTLAAANADLEAARGEEAQARARADGEAARATKSERQARRELAVANHDRAVALCEQGEIAQGMNWFLDAIRDAEAAGDAKLAATARANLAAWRYQLNALEHVVPLTFRPLAVAAVPDGSRAVVAGEFGTAGRFALVDPLTGKADPRVDVPAPIRAVAFDPRENWFVTGDEAGVLQARASKDGAALGAPLALPPTAGVRLPPKVLSVALHPSGLAVLAGCSDGTARLFRLKQAIGVGLVPDGEPQVFPHPTGFEVNAVAFHPDDGTPLVLTGSGASKTIDRNAKGDLGEARQFRTDSGAAFAPPINHRAAVRAAAYSPTGGHLMTGTGSLWSGEGRAWSTQSQLPLQGGVFPHIAEVNAVAYDRGGRFLLTAGQDRSVRVWDARTYRPIGQPLWHGKDVRAVAAAGSRVLSAGDENALRVWKVAPGPEYTEPSGEVKDSPVLAAGVLPRNDVWVSRMRLRLPKAAGEKARIVPAVERRVPGGGDLPDLPGPVRAISAGKRAVAVGGGDDEKTSFAAVYDIAGKQLGIIKLPTTATLPTTVHAVGLSPDETLCVVGCDNGDVRCWMVATGEELWRANKAHTDRVYAATFSPDGKTVLTCGKDSKAVLWDAQGRFLHEMKLTDIGLSAAFDEKGKWFAVGFAGGCRLYSWDGTNAPTVAVDLPHQAGIACVSVDAAGTTTVTGGTDGRVRWWDLATGKPIGPGWTTDGLVRGAQFTGRRTVFLAETDHRQGAYRTAVLPATAADPLPELTAWVHRTSGMRVVNGAAEVIAVAELAAAPVVTPTEQAVGRWEAEKKKPVEPTPERIGVVRPPVVPDPPIRPADPRPRPRPPDPKPGVEAGGVNVPALAEAALRLLFGK